MFENTQQNQILFTIAFKKMNYLSSSLSVVIFLFVVVVVVMVMVMAVVVVVEVVVVVDASFFCVTTTTLGLLGRTSFLHFDIKVPLWLAIPDGFDFVALMT